MLFRATLLFAALTACMTASASAETVERKVKANAASPIGGFFGYEVDTCYPSMIPDVKVRQGPAHGNVRIVPYSVTLGKDTLCPGKKVPGLVYVYTPAKGFKGSDEIVFDIPWRSTDIGPLITRTHTYRITVE